MSDTRWTQALMVAVTVLLTACLGAMSISEFDGFGPQVGGIVVFRPGAASADLWHVSVSTGGTVEADWIGRISRRPCILNPGAMARGGGSIVIEARRMSNPPVYRVHWAGMRTSDDGGDCGSDADLVLSRTDLQKLANSAGGFGPKPLGP